MSARLKSALGFQHKRIRQRLERPGPRYLNLGSGPKGLASKEWINVDGWTDNNVHFAIDLNRPLPFPDNCFVGIFTEHVLEHFDLEQGESLLRECFRVLQPGACLRIIVPDGERILRTYLESPSELIVRRGNGARFAMHAVNSYFHQRYEHQFIYDCPLLEHQLKQNGFAEVRRVSYGCGHASLAVALDDEKYAWESLYVEAVKPLTVSQSA